MNNNTEINIFMSTSIERFSSYLAKDLLAISEENAAKPIHEGLRSPNHLVAHCAGFYQGVASILKTGSRPEVSDEAPTAFLASITTREEALIAFNHAKEELLEAVNDFPAERWHEPVEGFFGPTMLSVASFGSLHTMYHDGQLNHVHMFDGDQEMHWFS